ncbi:hypothetical protein GPZ77_00030 [Streptomyces sp. QHH-9511]|uniref:hypothetical protein n=1 Tax=Streptomyces sp. QHH-9511 TaxID=2684468 RepID=UPI001318AF7B|nr:hypothetical protein [Streptomyces sp. QHH-9511]QGZ47028.1 hypothetical protein GPZ77_00030 [Streptomyces sp. QHH-9511]
MDLRQELLPPLVSRQRIDELSREIERIADLLITGSNEASQAIASFNAMTGHEYTSLDFTEYASSRSLEEFAKEAARPPYPKVLDITRDELVEIVQRILTGSPDIDYYLALLEANVPYPGIGNLIYNPDAGLGEATAEQIVDEALRYRPIGL